MGPDDVLGQVRVRERPVKLSSQEYKIMYCLAKHSDELVTRDQLVELVWKTDQGVSDETVDTALYRLRKKIKDRGEFIETRAGRGYVLHRAILFPKEHNT